MRRWLLLLFSSSLLMAQEEPLPYGNPASSCSSPWNFELSASLLYWGASEANLQYAIVQTIPYTLLVDDTPIGEINDFDFSPRFGSRIGLGVKIPHNDWQIEADWTRFHQGFSSLKMHLIFDGNFDADIPSLIALWPRSAASQSFSWGRISFDWDLIFDAFDLILGRTGFTNANFAFFPYVGAKGAKIDQFFRLHHTNLFETTTLFLPNTFYQIRSKNNFWGVGPKIGFQSQLFAPWGFSFLGSFSTAFLYGKFAMHRIDESNSPLNFNDDLFENYFRIAPMVEGDVGIEWRGRFLKEALRIRLQVCYEGQYWWDQNQQRQFFSPATTVGSFKAGGALTFKGWVFNGTIDY